MRYEQGIPIYRLQLLGRPVELWAHGKYQGTEDSGFVTWHDGRNRREPKETATIDVTGVIVNRFALRGNVHAERNGYTSGRWQLQSGYLRRETAPGSARFDGDLTDSMWSKLYAALREALENVPEAAWRLADLMAARREVLRENLIGVEHENNAAACRARAKAIRAAAGLPQPTARGRCQDCGRSWSVEELLYYTPDACDPGAEMPLGRCPGEPNGAGTTTKAKACYAPCMLEYVEAAEPEIPAELREEGAAHA